MGKIVKTSSTWEKGQENLWPQGQNLLHRPGCILTVGHAVSLVFWENYRKSSSKESPSGKHFSNLEQAKRCGANRKRRCIQIEITGITLALVLNSSQMREVSYEKGFYFATKEYIVVTSYGSCKCHFAPFCNFWVQDINIRNLLAQSSSVYFLYLMRNSLSIRLLHVTYGPFQAGLKTFTAHSWRHFTPCGALLGSEAECYLMGRGCAAALGWEAVTGCRQKVRITGLIRQCQKDS